MGLFNKAHCILHFGSFPKVKKKNTKSPKETDLLYGLFEDGPHPNNTIHWPS